MAFEIATASADDVLRVMGWAKDEGWNPANTDWVAFHAVDPGAFLIGRLDGEPVVSISVARYGAGFGFLGCYIARPVVRGKGYGIQVWKAGMKRLEGRTVGLDGVPAQQANYRKSGYRLAWNNARHEGAPAPAPMPVGVSVGDARGPPFDARPDTGRGGGPRPPRRRCRSASAWSMRAACRSTSSPPTTGASFPSRATASWRRGSPRRSAPRWSR